MSPASPVEFVSERSGEIVVGSSEGYDSESSSTDRYLRVARSDEAAPICAYPVVHSPGCGEAFNFRVTRDYDRSESKGVRC